MFLKILFLVIFLITIALFVFFILGLFLPAVKEQTLRHANPIFTPLELNYIKRVVDNDVKPSENRAVVLAAPADVPQEGRKIRLKYNGIKNCALFEHTYGTMTYSQWDCIGFGDCVRACPQDAIDIIGGIAQVTKNCCGCGACVKSCPKNLIELIPMDQKTVQYKNDVNNMHIIGIPEKKGFKFWRFCYRILS